LAQARSVPLARYFRFGLSDSGRGRAHQRPRAPLNDSTFVARIDDAIDQRREPRQGALSSLAKNTEQKAAATICG